MRDISQAPRALALVQAIMARAVAAFLAGDLTTSARLEARAARVERFADRLCR